jgi:DnaJ-class molecular chaperone
MSRHNVMWLVPEATTRCKGCKGTGLVAQVPPKGLVEPIAINCPSCNGTGKTVLSWELRKP